MQAEIEELMHETLLRAVVFMLWHGSASSPSPNFLPNYKLFCFFQFFWNSIFPPFSSAISSLLLGSFLIDPFSLPSMTRYLPWYPSTPSTALHLLPSSRSLCSHKISQWIWARRWGQERTLSRNQLIHGWRRWKASTSKEPFCSRPACQVLSWIRHGRERWRKQSKIQSLQMSPRMANLRQRNVSVSRPYKSCSDGPLSWAAKVISLRQAIR